VNLLKLSISAGSAEACVTGRCCDFKLAAWIKKKKIFDSSLRFAGTVELDEAL